MNIYRYYSGESKSLLQPNKVFVLYGPRRVGKTTLLKEMITSSGLRARLESGEDLRIREILGSESISTIRDFASGYEFIAIDEAQRIPGIGLGLKLLVDHCPGVRVCATGSASLELASSVGEPLTGRQITRILYPLSLLELQKFENRQELQTRFEQIMVFGSYPESFTARSRTQRTEYLLELTGATLLRDILELDRVRNPGALLALLRLLAYQIGHDVSTSELGRQLGLDNKTVTRYLDLLEKTFVIRSIGALSRNLRKEISKSHRYYFLDNGVRNAVINNFNPVAARNDIGMLWENFAFIERQKRNEYLRYHVNPYFWRTHDRKEIDYVEESGGTFQAFEFKWKSEAVRAPKDFVSAYPGSSFTTINALNLLDYACDGEKAGAAPISET